MDLIGAAKSGDIVRVRELLDSGKDPNLQDKDGDTALMRASAGIWQSPRHPRPPHFPFFYIFTVF